MPATSRLRSLVLGSSFSPFHFRRSETSAKMSLRQSTTGARRRKQQPLRRWNAVAGNPAVILSALATVWVPGLSRLEADPDGALVGVARTNGCHLTVVGHARPDDQWMDEVNAFQIYPPCVGAGGIDREYGRVLQCLEPRSKPRDTTRATSVTLQRPTRTLGRSTGSGLKSIRSPSPSAAVDGGVGATGGCHCLRCRAWCRCRRCRGECHHRRTFITG